jgi:hypothetical protein
MTTRATRAQGLAVATALLVASAAVPTSAAQADRADGQDRQDGQEQASQTAVSTLKGLRYRMASTKMADEVTRFADATADQVTADGSPVIDAPAHTDLAAVYVAPIRMPKKLLTKMANDYPRGAVGSFYGSDADWQEGDRAIFIAAELAARRPGDAAGQQVEVGLDGREASPLLPGSTDALAGIERFSLSGIFNNGSWSSGTTDISGRQPGDPIEFYNAHSGVFGFYEPRTATYYVVVPREGDTNAVTVALRSSTPTGEVVDRLVLPDGGRFIDLNDPTGGFDGKATPGPLTCRAIEVASTNTDGAADPGSTLIRYTVGTRGDADPGDAGDLLAAAADAVGSIPVTLTAVGADEEPTSVTGELAMGDGGTTATLTLPVPPGRWSFAAEDDEGLRTPAGEAIIEHVTLTGYAGVQTGPGIDGVLAGDPACAPLEAGSVADEPAETGAPSDTDGVPAEEDQSDE